MKNASLKFRIYTGFAIIGALLILTGLVSYFGQVRQARDLAAIQQVEQLNADVLLVDRDIQELRLRVDRYVATGHESLVKEVAGIDQRIAERIGATDTTDQEMLDLFEQIQIQMKDYASHFVSVVGERTLRQRLTDIDFPSQAVAVREAFLEALSEQPDDTAENKVVVANARLSVDAAETELLRYFDDPDSTKVRTAVSHFTTAVDTIQQLTIAEEHRNQAIAAIRELQKTGLRAVQATRSYLFFRNVVMAGVASEVAYFSRQLRSMANQKRDLISQRVVDTRKTVARVTTAMAILAVVLSAGIAFRLAMLIVPPITELTRTFEQLSAGGTLESSEEVVRDDEIGRMTVAAHAFSRQNEKTRRLFQESKALAVELKTKAAQLEATNEELDSFAYVASHDLKSPLRGIRELATWIEEDAGPVLPPESKEYLGHLVNRVTKMETLLRDLLDYSRAGRIAQVPEEVVLSELLEGIVDITDNPQNVRVTWPDNLPTIHTPRPPLEQVLLNLLGNAIKHNHHESGGWVKVSLTTENQFYHFTVADNGPGIDRSNHERAFQMYQRVGSRGVDGSGMGLAIVKKQIEYFGGTIQLTSRLGDGAKFEFTWPVNIERQTESDNDE